MKRKIIAIILLSIIFLIGFKIKSQAEEGRLLPAVKVTSTDEKYGFIDETGNFIISPVYSFVRGFNDKGIAIVANGNFEYNLCDVYFIDKSGKTVSGPFSSYIPEFKNGFAILNSGTKSSIIVDETGKVVLKSKYSLYDYSDGLVSFYDFNNSLYGFIDLTGKVILPAKYLSVQNFIDGKSIVEVGAGKYSVIDKTGKILEVLKFYNSYNTSEQLTVFINEKTSTYGYKLTDGTIAIKPEFNTADQFRDGYAVVGVDDGKYHIKYGLIDKKGKYAIKPEYSGIHNLGKGLFSVSPSSDSTYNDMFVPKAIFNSKGEKLTDYKYYSVDQYVDDYAVASDDTTTFFIDVQGNIVDKLPRLNGIGNMKLDGNIIKAELDGGLTYLKENGEIIWQKSETMPLDNNISVKSINYRRDHVTFIQYPEVAGIENKTIQNSVNAKLKKDFISEYEGKNKDKEYNEDVNISFSATKNKDLLIIEKSGYWYPVGAAHGQPSKDYLYIDTKTGAFYQLKDLFKANSKYTDKLTTIVNYKLNLNAKIGAISGGILYNVDSVKVSADQHFIIDSESIKVYYYPYEIASYAAGFPEFAIPYGQITSIIDTNGAFWNSFDKKIVNSKINVFSDTKESENKSVESLMSSYEKNIIEAINNNNFSKVEAYLLKGSSLYNSQKKLIQSLNKQKIKEKLTKYEIYALDYDYEKAEYKVYVLEEVAIKYTGKNYVNKKYGWCYTVKADKSGTYKLSDIIKW